MYKKFTNLDNQEVIIYDGGDNKIISFVAGEGNADYQRYLEWLAEGNEPEIIEI